jgi:hypothetical protein
MAVSGAIATRARSNLPTTWDRLDTFDTEMMQTLIDDVKYQLFGTVVTPNAEATTYTSLVLEYAGKLVAIAVIPAAVDYWMNQPTSITATGTEEVESYPDRIAALWKLQEQLIAQAKALEADVNEETDIIVRAKLGAPLVSDAGVELVTSNPSDFPRAFDFPTGT